MTVAPTVPGCASEHPAFSDPLCLDTAENTQPGSRFLNVALILRPTAGDARIPRLAPGAPRRRAFSGLAGQVNKESHMTSPTFVVWSRVERSAACFLACWR